MTHLGNGVLKFTDIIYNYGEMWHNLTTPSSNFQKEEGEADEKESYNGSVFYNYIIASVLF